MNEEEQIDEALKADESQIEVESPATEELPIEEPSEKEVNEPTGEETPEVSPESEGRKTAQSRIRDLVAEKKQAEAQAEKERVRADSLADQMRKATQVATPVLPNLESTNETELTVEDVMRRNDALIQIRLAQQENIHRVNSEATEAITAYPQLNPDSDSFDAELSEAISTATLAHIQNNPTASVKGFVTSLMKPYQRSLEKQAVGQQETLAKQVSEQAMRPTQVQEQEKPFSELSIEEMEAKLPKVWH